MRDAGILDTVVAGAAGAAGAAGGWGWGGVLIIVISVISVSLLLLMALRRGREGTRQREKRRWPSCCGVCVKTLYVLRLLICYPIPYNRGGEVRRGKEGRGAGRIGATDAKSKKGD